MSQIETKARRVQRCRCKGWKAPLSHDGSKLIYVGRGSIWGNPWRVTKTRDAAKCKHLFLHTICGQRGHLTKGLLAYRETVRDRITVLSFEDLMCWCPVGSPCHADLLLEWANDEEWFFPDLRGELNVAAVMGRFQIGERIAEIAERFGKEEIIIESVIREYL